MMTADSLLQQARETFKNESVINSYKPVKIKDLNGFQYLVKGKPTPIKGAIHTEKFLESNDFGRFSGASIILSTGTKLETGDLIEANNDLYAIERQKAYNDKMKEFDYICYSIYDYYKDFIIDSEEQANRILGTNSLRYILSLDSDIPIFPSFFSLPTGSTRYIKVNIASSRARSPQFKNKDNLIEQHKQDDVELLAVGLDTNQLQKFAFDLFENQNAMYGIGDFPNWEQNLKYNKEFDLKANIFRCNFLLNYRIITSEKLEADHIIQKVAWNFNFI